MDSSNQSQKTGDNSVNLQVIGDLNFGITYSEARSIALDVFKDNMMQLSKEAAEEAMKLVEEFTDAVLVKLQNEAQVAMNSFRDPDMQYALFSAQRDYSRSGQRSDQKELQLLLVDMLVERAKLNHEDEMKKIVLNEALLIAPKLTIKQLNALSLNFLIREALLPGVINLETFKSTMRMYLLPFLANPAQERSDYLHIEYARCGTNSILQSYLGEIIKIQYCGMFSNGFQESDIAPLGLSQVQRNDLIIKCLRNGDKFQVNAIDDNALKLKSAHHGLNNDQINKLSSLQKSNLISNEDVKKELFSIDPSFRNLADLWDNSYLGRLQLTTVGFALAHANIKKSIGVSIDLGIWVKN